MQTFLGREAGVGLLSDWREWTYTNLTPVGKNWREVASENRVYGGKSVTKGALYPHSRVYLTNLTEHAKNSNNIKGINCEL